MVVSTEYSTDVRKGIEHSKGIFSPSLPERNPEKHPWGIPASPAGGHTSPVAMAASLAPRGCLPKRLAARRGTAMRGLNMPLRMG